MKDNTNSTGFVVDGLVLPAWIIEALKEKYPERSRKAALTALLKSSLIEYKPNN